MSLDDSLPIDLASAHALIIAQRAALSAAEQRAAAAESETDPPGRTGAPPGSRAPGQLCCGVGGAQSGHGTGAARGGTGGDGGGCGATGGGHRGQRVGGRRTDPGQRCPGRDLDFNAQRRAVLDNHVARTVQPAPTSRPAAIRGQHW